jgi:hypothetical protein
MAAPASAQPTPPPLSIGLVLGIASFAVVGVAAIWFGISSDMLRDSQPTSFGGAGPKGGGQFRRPFSLAQTQMAWWFCIIIASYLYIAFTTSKGSTIPNVAGGMTDQALILLGIGTGTALGAAMIEQIKSDKLATLNTFQSVLQQLAANPAAPDSLITQRDALAAQLASEGFLRDILTDVDGISLHRFQSFAWTLVLGGMFLINVFIQDAMPQFSSTLLALLGISGGTYLGFKVPEQPA